MAAGDGWTSRLLTGLAEHLTDNGIGTWRPSGAYQDGEVGIVIRAIPSSPDRIITLAAYPVNAGYVGLADTTAGIQVRPRAGKDPREVEDLGDAIFDLLDGVEHLTLGGIHVVQMYRQSYSPLGADANGRWEASHNYYADAMRPTANRT